MRAGLPRYSPQPYAHSEYERSQNFDTNTNPDPWSINSAYTTSPEASLSRLDHQIYLDRHSMAPFHMPPEWVNFHARGTRTDSRMLPPAAFPSLPIDQPPQVRSNQQSGETSDVDDAMESDRDGNTQRFDEPNVISEAQWEAMKYHAERNTPVNRPVNRPVLTERHRLIEADTLPEVKRRSTRSSWPRSVDYNHLQKKHKHLMAKRRTLEMRLSELGHRDPQLETAIRVAKAKDIREQPASINALWRTVQILKWQMRKLEAIEDRRRLICKAKKKLFGFGKLPEWVTPKPEPPFRRGAENPMLPPVGWAGDSEWHEMRAAVKMLPGSKTSFDNMGWPDTYRT